ncbi:MAG: ParB N-terminal domain-containing protein [Pyrinomonadaceae bacterium]
MSTTIENENDLTGVGWAFLCGDEGWQGKHAELGIETKPYGTTQEAQAEARTESPPREAETHPEQEIEAPPETPTQATAETTETLLDVDVIRTDGGTQMRAELNFLKIAEYAELMKEGVRFAPSDVFFDGEDYYVADGFHRVAATKQAELAEINVTVHQGTRRDAVLFSIGANASHGIHRTNDDKRLAVTTLFKDTEWQQWTDSRIAKAAGVSQPFVSAIRRELVTQNVLSEQTVRKSADGRTIDTAKIGAREDESLNSSQSLLPGVEEALAAQPESHIDDQRRAADMEMADPGGHLEQQALEDEAARRDFDPQREANMDAMIEEERASNAAHTPAEASTNTTDAAHTLAEATSQPTAAPDPEGWSRAALMLTIQIMPGAPDAERVASVAARVGESAPVFKSLREPDIYPLPPALAALVEQLKASFITPVAAKASRAETVKPSAKKASRASAKKQTSKKSTPAKAGV